MVSSALAWSLVVCRGLSASVCLSWALGALHAAIDVKATSSYSSTSIAFSCAWYVLIVGVGDVEYCDSV